MHAIKCRGVLTESCTELASLIPAFLQQSIMLSISASFLAISLCISSLVSPVLGSNAKRGIAFAESNGNDIGVTKNSQISWVYAWQATPPSYVLNAGLQYIPMQWGSAGASSFQAAVKALGATTILVSDATERDYHRRF